MMDKLNIYSALLKYPKSEEYYQYIDLIDISYLYELKRTDIETLQEEYVKAFDFNKKSSLFISFHIASNDDERRKILIAMNEFLNAYEIKKTDSATPDYLPDVLDAYQKAINEEKEEVEALEYLKDMLIMTAEKIINSLEAFDSLYVKLLYSLREDLRTILDNVEV